MRKIYEAAETYAYLDPTATQLIQEGRDAYRRLDLELNALIGDGSDTLYLPWCGDRVMNTIRLLLARVGAEVACEGIALRLSNAVPEEARAVLQRARPDPAMMASTLAEGVRNKWEEKYDSVLSEGLLCLDYASRSIDLAGARQALSGS